MKQFLHKYFGATKWKRLFDIVVSFFSLIILSPLFLFIIAVNYFTPNCKVFFSHERRGRSGKPFKIYKFQTMKNDTPNCAPFVAVFFVKFHFLHKRNIVTAVDLCPTGKSRSETINAVFKSKSVRSDFACTNSKQ